MKINTNTRFEEARYVTAAEAVQYVVNRNINRYDHHEREAARGEALQLMLGRLMSALVDNGALRPDQIEMIFDYDVSAEA